MRRRTESLSTGYTATITSKGQFTLPQALCLKLGIKRGDKVAMEVCQWPHHCRATAQAGSGREEGCVIIVGWRNR